MNTRNSNAKHSRTHENNIEVTQTLSKMRKHIEKKQNVTEVRIRTQGFYVSVKDFTAIPALGGTQYIYSLAIS